MFSRRWWWTSLLVILGIGLAIRLGFWQLDRNAGKLALINHIKKIQALPMLDLNSSPLPPDLNEMEYRQVEAFGKYDFDNQVALRNQVRKRMSGTDPGLALLTPLVLNGGQAIIVERGWIPLEYKSPDSWRQFDEPGEVRVEGIIRLSLEKGEFGRFLVDPTLSPGQSRLDFWNFVNLPRIQEQIPYPILSIYIQQAPGKDFEALPASLLEQPDLDPGAHIGFAIQWFFYAGLLIFGYPVWLNKQKTKTLSDHGKG